jgi:hypothetical protein
MEFEVTIKDLKPENRQNEAIRLHSLLVQEYGDRVVVDTIIKKGFWSNKRLVVR